MDQHLQQRRNRVVRPQSDTGQTLALFIFLIVGILAFVGIAVDVGFMFARSSQFSSAVDAAALAGVIEMKPAALTLTEADARAQQFLDANGWATPGMTFVSTSTLTLQGFPQYSITVTWPVETFFLRILGFTNVDVTRSATAVYMAQAEVFTPTFYERGQMRKAAQFIMGPDSCTVQGDPISSKFGLNASQPNTDPAHFNETIRYRIRVPVATYTMTNRLTVQLFDPDSGNYNQTDGAAIDYSQWYSTTYHLAGETKNCGTQSISGGGLGQQCVFRIEDTTTLERTIQNPLWFVRVDENYSADCAPIPDSASGNTTTVYRLYYLDQEAEEVNIASYTGNNPQLTDLKWYTPPGFEVVLDPIPIVDGSRYIYLEVEATGGSAKNVWDLWAGPPAVAASLPENVNFRNLMIANHPLSVDTGGVQIFALGRMPLQHFTSEDVTIPLVPVPSSLGGGTVYVSVFDYEANFPLNFTIDTVSRNTFFEDVIAVSGEADPLAIPRQVSCGGDTDCEAEWTMPQVRLGIPQTYFFGGTLFATTGDARSDAHTWMLTATAGRPFLTR
ncbi:MAG: Tad domain-containing protein [Anaerolineae bacterium]|nr:Tad domain-containing protein [Anaerolineae bacterium]